MLFIDPIPECIYHRLLVFETIFLPFFKRMLLFFGDAFIVEQFITVLDRLYGRIAKILFFAFRYGIYEVTTDMDLI